MLLCALGFGQPSPTTLLCDNKGAITMSLHPANSHIDMRRHFCRQHTEEGAVRPVYQPTPDMVADYLTKQTARPTHERHALRSLGQQSAPVPIQPIVHIVDDEIG